MTTQACRLYLCITPKGIYWMPFVKVNNQWQARALSSRVAEPDVARVLLTPQYLEDDMREAFFAQFPVAEESYYDDLLPFEDVKAMLEAAPYVSTLVQGFVNHSASANLSVDEADGIVTVMTEEGQYMLPFSKVRRGDSEDMELQMYRGKLHPYSLWPIGRISSLRPLRSASATCGNFRGSTSGIS